MKKSMFLFLLSIASALNVVGQKLNFKVRGIVIDTNKVKFAYLTTLSHQVTISSDSLFLKAPIVDGKFEFNGNFDLKGNEYQHACIFLEERGNISKAETKSKFRQLVWVVGREENTHEIILEDIDLKIEDRLKVNAATIVAGGILTTQLYERSEATTARNKKLVEFIRKYPDSPISYDVVVSLNSLISDSDRDRLESFWGSVPELFAELSQKRKESKSGIALKKSIYERHVKGRK